MMTSDQIIDGCGGTVNVASELDLTPSTVSSWRTANHIPRWWQDPVLAVASKLGFGMDKSDFPPKPRRKSAKDIGVTVDAQSTGKPDQLSGAKTGAA
ncbi:carph-isopro domain-containing protein [Novosphingobium sp. KN65.2]|uniref:carph-isopro domain-containing protein n=1 Tax=Novosphingobium sp. KN65.2 TaxID=1478134 RepID=UPI0005E99FAC|nr:hypothetical protein [Novosphingobium sp. KN65.2]CDO35021.1 conserved hypothetical protein [Novosphingobium sp. KN65.2]